MIATAGAFGAPNAFGCTCVVGQTDAREQLEESAGAVIGTVRASREVPSRSGSPSDVILTVGVESAFGIPRTDHVDVRTGSQGGACGLGPVPVGAPFSQFLSRDPDGELATSICDRVAPSVLRRAAKPLPPPRHGKPAVVLGGAFGRLRSLALDADGRAVGYARADGFVTGVSVCPGGRRVVETYRTEGPSGHYETDLRTLPGLALVRRTTVPGGSVYPADVSCRDALAHDVLVFGAVEGAAGGGRLLSWTRGALRPVRRTSRARAVIAGSRLYEASHGRRQRITAVELRTGRVTPVVAAAGQFSRIAGDARGRFAGVISLPLVKSRPRATLVTFDPHARGARLHELKLRSGFEPVALLWTDHARLVLVSYDGAVRMFDVSLHRIGARTRLHDASGQFAVRGTTLYGVVGGRLIRAHLPGGRARIVRQLPVRDVATIASTPAGGSSARAVLSRAVACAAWLRLGPVGL